MHALGNVAGENRPEDSIILNGDAEESLRRLIYEVASESSKLTLSVSNSLKFSLFLVLSSQGCLSLVSL